MNRFYQFDAEKFVQNCCDKTKAMMDEELDIDAMSLFEWFIDVAPTREFAPDVIRNFEKIFAILLWWDFLKENDCLIPVTSSEAIIKIKEFSKQFRPEPKEEQGE